MTEEERAEQWLAKTSHGDEFEYYEQILRKEAFLAGLHEGQPKWHKVADGDLPKDEIGIHNTLTYRVVTVNAYGNPCETYCSYNNRTKQFEIIHDNGHRVYWKEVQDVIAWQEIPELPQEVIAWCEIPQFEGDKQ